MHLDLLILQTGDYPGVCEHRAIYWWSPSEESETKKQSLWVSTGHLNCCMQPVSQIEEY